MPKQVDRNALKSVLDQDGFEGDYDFLYVPMDFAKAVCFGFAIVNFKSESRARVALAHFVNGDGRIFGQTVTAEWSESSHGVEALLEKYRNSKVMLDSIAELYKPLYLVDGLPKPFPPRSSC